MLADISEKNLVLYGVPSVIGCDLVVTVGDQRYLCGDNLQHQLGERIDGISLDVKLGGNPWTKVTDILIADMTLVRTWMYGDALSTKALYVACNGQHVGVVAASGVAQCGNLIDIYT